ncbi:putative MAM and LDL-receptor class A domain-containing protein 1 isoform X1 [Apostichopus japonicus]|uniref:Putative MAM and LDL-receptor class A domain-containing protein 1 isoform X1 n=1 Tax=Stichopus japonicus TaxID=307972 RepID=A0A2G8LN11_STIJA|nr:putative MAM and LDL-receptor class A domain-containing protein 1 isoform X1 [Apostichopus japonicus]
MISSRAYQSFVAKEYWFITMDRVHIIAVSQVSKRPGNQNEHSGRAVAGHLRGYYVYIESSSPAQSGDTSALISPDIAAGNTRCLEFFYHMYGVNVGSLEVQTLDTDDGSALPQRIWRKSGNRGETWQRGLVTIDATTNTIQIIFQATLGSVTQNDIALDDITFTPGLCAVDSISCNFEDPLLCGYTFDETADVRLIRGSGGTPSSFTGPSVDHTFDNATGYYMFLESSGLKEGLLGRLVSPIIAGSPDGSNCVILWYHLFGESVGTISVYAKNVTDTSMGSPLWSLSGNRGDLWRATEMDLTSPKDFQVIIECMGSGDYRGDIAFDDVMITGAICPGEYVYTNTSGVSCDFESVDICYYKQDQTDTADWTWQNGATRDHFSGPEHDKTRGDELGFYLVFAGDPSSPGTGLARLISPKFQATTGTSCLEFWYHMYGNDVEALNVYVVNENYRTLPQTPTWSASGDKGNYWHRATITFARKTTESRIVFEGRNGVKERDDIAIDEVTLYASSACPDFVTDAPPPTTRPVTVNDISCDFENDFCDYAQATDDLFDWTRHQGPTKASGSGPNFDHTFGTADGYYALMDCSNQYLRFDDRTRIISPLLQGSSMARCLRFFYYKYSTNERTQDFLNVYITQWGHRLNFDPDWSIFGVTPADEWMEGWLELPPSAEPIQVVFEASYAFYEYYCDIAIDDITLQNQACPVDPDGSDGAENINCDFEDSQDSFCGYTQGGLEVIDTIDWSIGSGSTPTDETGPDNDHTLGTAEGHYMFIEASLPHRPSDNAVLTSPRLLTGFDHMCLQFYYHMSGKDTGWLRVLTTIDNENTKEIARLSGQQESGWVPMLIDIPPFRGGMQISFEGKLGQSFYGDIAIDDILTVREPCGGFDDEISCDFEFGFDQCYYDSVNTGRNSRWAWFEVYSGDGPINGGTGSYIFSASESTSTKVASVTTNAYRLKQVSCVMFDYAIIGASSTLQINRAISGAHVELITLEGETDWTSYQVTSETSVEGAGKINFIATTTTGTVAVDNVMVLVGSCDNQPGEPVTNGEKGNAAGLIVGLILAGLAVVVVAAVVILFLRSRSKEPNINFIYKNHDNDPSLTSTNTLSTDPGIANPNYDPAKLTTDA